MPRGRRRAPARVPSERLVLLLLVLLALLGDHGLGGRGGGGGGDLFLGGLAVDGADRLVGIAGEDDVRHEGDLLEADAVTHGQVADVHVDVGRDDAGQALELDLAVGEVPTPYYARPEGSASKLSTWRDGLRILATIVGLYRSERPLSFFSMIGIVLAVVSVVLAIPIFITYFEEGIVPRVPTAILSTGLMLLAFLSIVAGLVLDTVTRGRREMKRLVYLQQRAPEEK